MTPRVNTAESASAAVRHRDVGATGQLDSDIATVLKLVAKARRPHYWHMAIDEARRTYARGVPILDIAPRRVHHCEDILIDAGEGLQVPIRLYLPHDANWSQPLPVLIFLHGGGFTVGSIETVDSLCRMFCSETPCAVVSVDYRLAPEHRFPAAFEDAMTALRWVVDHGHVHALDPRRIAVGGDSAGGTLAAACALAARDAGIGLALQLLIYPGTCANQDTDSHFAYAEGYLLERETILWFFNQYLSAAADRADWRFAPLEAPDLSRLAPAWVAVAEFDPLVDEGIAYAQRLKEAGTQTELHFFAGMIHAFFNMGGFVPAARSAHEDAVRALRHAFA